MSRSVWSGILAVFALVLLGCGGGSEYKGTGSGGGTPPPAPTYAIRGAAKVGGAYTFAAIAGLDVRALSGSTQVAATTTDPAGRFSLSVPLLASGQSYTIETSGNGYLTCSYPNVATEGTSVDLPVFPMIPTAFSTGQGSIAGTIVNALDGNGVGSMNLRLFPGLHQNGSQAPYGSYTGNGDGTFTLANIPAGYYTLQAAREGFITINYDVVCLGGRVSPNQDTATSPTLQPGQMRIVLTWGQDPFDLDSHLTGPDGKGGRFHTWYASKDAGVANLDLDDTSSYGPETTTITQQFSGVYRFYVHDFSNGSATTSQPSSALSRSGAKVQVFTPAGLVATFNVPSNQGGTIWSVFEYDGATVRAVNSIGYGSTGNLAVARPAGEEDAADPGLPPFGTVPKH